MGPVFICRRSFDIARSYFFTTVYCIQHIHATIRTTKPSPYQSCYIPSPNLGGVLQLVDLSLEPLLGERDGVHLLRQLVAHHVGFVVVRPLRLAVCSNRHD